MILTSNIRKRNHLNSVTAPILIMISNDYNVITIYYNEIK